MQRDRWFQEERWKAGDDRLYLWLHKLANPYPIHTEIALLQDPAFLKRWELQQGNLQLLSGSCMQEDVDSV